MTTLELRTSIVAELDQMSVEMLESVHHYVRRLRRHACPTRRASEKKVKTTTETEEFTPGIKETVLSVATLAESGIAERW